MGASPLTRPGPAGPRATTPPVTLATARRRSWTHNQTGPNPGGRSQSIARELAPHGIRVVAVAPGAIATPINADVLADPEAKAAVEAQIPYGRGGEVADVARAVAWVASEEADYLVGSTIFVDGGMTLYPRFT